MRPQSEPIFNVPTAVIGTIAVLAAIYVLQAYVLDPVAVLWEFSFIPARFSLTFGYDPVQALSDKLALDPGSDEIEQRLALAREIVLEGSVKPWTLLTYALLHGGWTHLVLNSVWLLAFGSAMARRFGTARFLAFMAVTAIAGSLGHFITRPHDVVPLVGASAAVSGCMAGAMRFAFQPGAPLGFGRLGEDDAYRLPALSLAGVLTDGRVLKFLVVWFVLNLAAGLGAGNLGIVDASIAWEAHIGGFVAGLLLFPLFDPLWRQRA